MSSDLVSAETPTLAVADSLHNYLSSAAIEAVPYTLAPRTYHNYVRAASEVHRRFNGRELNDYNLSLVLADMRSEAEQRYAAKESANLVGRAKSVPIGKMSITVCALRWFAKHAGQPDPVGPSSLTVITAARRAASDQRQVTKLTWEKADRLVMRAKGEGNLIGKRDAAIMAVMSDAMLRTVEVAALRVSDFTDPTPKAHRR